MKKDYNKLVEKINTLKYEDGSEIKVYLTEEKDVKGFDFFLTSDFDFKKALDKIAKECGFDCWIPSDEDSISFF